MRDKIKKRIMVLVFTLCFLMLGSAIYIVDQVRRSRSQAVEIPYGCSFTVESDGVEREIQLLKETNGIYYLYVPGYAELSDMQVHVSFGSRFYLDGRQLKTGDTLSAYECDKEYSLLLSGQKKEETLVIVRTGGMATLYLDTASGNMNHLVRSKDYQEEGDLLIYTEDGCLDYSGDVDKIQGRGNTSWRDTEKKPFNLRLSEEADLLGMGSGKRWVLINNYNEVTNLSNKLIYDLADQVGLAYSPDCQLVDAYFNGVYYGVYLLSEKIEIAENRVAVTEPDNSSDSSYLVTMNFKYRVEAGDEAYIRTARNYYMTITAPKDVSEELQDQIASDFRALERALSEEDGIDPKTGKSWQDMIDLDSWVKKYLIEEIFENVDAGRLSQYFYKTGQEGDDKIYAGPVWDYNSAFGNAHTDQASHNPNCLKANARWIKYPKQRNWFYDLYHQEAFYNRMVEIYEQDFLPLLNELADHGMADLAEQIQDSNHANFLRWKVSAENYTNVEDEYDTMHQFLVDRIAFLNSDWLEGVDYCYITTRDVRMGSFTYYAIPKGEVFSEDTLPEPTRDEVGESGSEGSGSEGSGSEGSGSEGSGSEGSAEEASSESKIKSSGKTFVAWYDEHTKEPYDFSKPVTRDELHLYGVWE